MRRRSGRFQSDFRTTSHGKKPPVEIVERVVEVAGLEVNHRRAGEAPVLYVHGVPTASWDWIPFL
jgi:hypothetical protein